MISILRVGSSIVRYSRGLLDTYYRRMKTIAATLIKDDLLQEVQFFLTHKTAILKNVHSNRQGIKTSFTLMNNLVKQGLPTLEESIELDTCLIKLNTYIGMSQLNDMEDHTLELRYISRLPRLLFKYHLNKLKIIKDLRIDGDLSQLIQIPADLGYLKQLRTLDISNCRVKRLPKEIGKLKKLEILIVAGNDFSEIPREIGELSNLKMLDLSDNPFLIEIPEEIGNCEALEELRAHHDNLVFLPDSLSHCEQLRVLDLDFNQLSSLPDELEHLLHLETLKVRHNQLKTLFAGLIKLNKLTEIDIAENADLLLPPSILDRIH